MVVKTELFLCRRELEADFYLVTLNTHRELVEVLPSITLHYSSTDSFHSQFTPSETYSELYFH